jgi:hypothetical protein
MSADRGRRIAVVVLVLLLLLPPLATVLPGSPGAVRVAGITLLWWYTALVGPLLAAAVAAVALLRTSG